MKRLVLTNIPTAVLIIEPEGGRVVAVILETSHGATITQDVTDFDPETDHVIGQGGVLVGSVIRFTRPGNAPSVESATMGDPGAGLDRATVNSLPDAIRRYIRELEALVGAGK